MKIKLLMPDTQYCGWFLSLETEANELFLPGDVPVFPWNRDTSQILMKIGKYWKSLLTARY